MQFLQCMSTSQQETLKEKTAKGLFWGGMSNGLQQLLNFVFGIFLGRLLCPSDYGMVGMLTIFSLIASSLQESGFTAALANRTTVGHRELNSVFWFSVCVSGMLYLFLFACAPLIADFYHIPELTALARYQFLGFFISSLGTAHFAKLFREMKVKQRTIATFTALSVSGAVGVIMAFFGFSYWGIATQNLCYILISTSMFWYFSGWRPTFSFDWTPVHEMFGFSCKILATNLFTHLNNNIFSVILGKCYNEQAVGHYNQGNKWCSMGQNLITGMVNSVAQPVLAQIHDDRERKQRVFRKMLQFTAFISFPVMLGLSIISEELIVLLITDKWIQSAYILRILCIGGAFLPISQLYVNLLISQGKSNLYLWNTIALSVLQLGVLIGLYPHGLHPMLWAAVALQIGWLCVWYRLISHEINLTAVQALGDITMYLLPALSVMGITSLICDEISSLLLRLGSKIIMAGVLYTGIMLVAQRWTVMGEMVTYLKKRITS